MRVQGTTSAKPVRGTGKGKDVSGGGEVPVGAKVHQVKLSKSELQSACGSPLAPSPPTCVSFLVRLAAVGVYRGLGCPTLRLLPQ